MPPAAGDASSRAVALVLYRELLRSCKKLEGVMHVGQHYTFVGTAVHTFAKTNNSHGARRGTPETRDRLESR
jgi:hypothetical protein